MENNKAITTVEQNALAVSYEVLGTKVDLDIDFVKKYLVRGKSEYVSNQELVFFINTCKMQKLNPLVAGEVYLIKYQQEQPAQMVVGKDAYTKRAFLNPNYIGKQDGIVVQRGNDIVQKEGCCLYPGEILIGGWCRIFHIRQGVERVAFREVALAEYNKNMANWKSMPATMINKVAISQCIRDAFPADYEGLYSEEEMIASGAISTNPANVTTISDGAEAFAEAADRTITQEERKALFSLVQSTYGKERGNVILKAMLDEREIESTNSLTKSVYDEIVAKIQESMTDDGDNENDAQ